jgi:hypothetical protein
MTVASPEDEDDDEPPPEEPDEPPVPDEPLDPVPLLPPPEQALKISAVSMTVMSANNESRFFRSMFASSPFLQFCIQT